LAHGRGYGGYALELEEAVNQESRPGRVAHLLKRVIVTPPIDRRNRLYDARTLGDFATNQHNRLRLTNRPLASVTDKTGQLIFFKRR
jgi:hypothetical protein